MANQGKEMASFTRIWILIFCIITATITLTDASVQTNLYVSPNGSGTSFTQDAPGSLIDVPAKVRTLNASMTGDIAVNLFGGTYYLNSTFTLGPSDSGMNGYNVIYQGVPGQYPVISGGKKIVATWTLHDASKNIWQATVDASLNFRQVYVNDKRAIRARQPNASTDPTQLFTTGRYPLFGVNPPIVDITQSQITNVTNLNQVEIFWTHFWQCYMSRIASYSVNATAVTLAYIDGGPWNGFLSSWAGDTDTPAYPHCPNYYLENAYEFIDAESEWYLNTGTHILYYKPRTGENMATAEVIAPTVETLVNLSGTNTSTPIHNIIFYGICFKHTTWMAPSSEGYYSGQAGVVSIYPSGHILPAMVEFDYANNLVFSSNTFTHGGAHGILTFHSTSSDAIYGNHFYDLSGGGIYIFVSYVQTGTGVGSTYDLIKNNTIEYTGLDYSESCAIYISQVYGLSLVHNVIRQVPYDGISIGWSWGDTNLGAGANEIGWNFEEWFMRLLDDGGAIYNLGYSLNSSYHDNYFRYAPFGPYSKQRSGLPGPLLEGIMIDNGSCYLTVVNNVIETMPYAFFAANAPNHDNNISYNWYYNCTAYFWMSAQNTFVGNTPCAPPPWPATAQNIINNSGITNPTPRLLYLVPSGPLYGTSKSSVTVSAKIFEYYGQQSMGANNTVTFSITGPGIISGPNSVAATNGAANITVYPTARTGVITITATASGLTADAIKIPINGNYSFIATAEPRKMLPDGFSICRITATIVDGTGTVVNDNIVDTVTFTLKGNGSLLGVTQMNPINGIATIQLQSPLVEGISTVTASAVGITSGSVTIEFIDTQPVKISCSVNPAIIIANNIDISTITASVLQKDNFVVTISTATIIFNIIGRATLTGSNVVQASNGIATIGIKGNYANTITLTAVCPEITEGATVQLILHPGTGAKVRNLVH